MIEVIPLKAFTDNYIWALVSKKSVYVVDPGDPNPVLSFLKENDLNLKGILITHHHFDHTGGIKTLVDKFNIPVFGPSGSKIEGISNELKENDSIRIFEQTFKIFEVPGHTLDHIAYYSEDSQKLLFCGDTLFSGGCGRLFEGTPLQMYESLAKLKNLSPDTLVYCTHEYTESNLNFAVVVNNKNEFLKNYHSEVQSKRKNDEITLPSSIGKELKINPFLRLNDENIISNASNFSSSILTEEVDTLKAVREWKDNF